MPTPPWSVRVAYVGFGSPPDEQWRSWAETMVRSPSWPFVVAGRSAVAFLVVSAVMVWFCIDPPSDPRMFGFGLILSIGSLCAIPLAFGLADSEASRSRELERLRAAPDRSRYGSILVLALAYLALSPWMPRALAFPVFIALMVTNAVLLTRRRRRRSAG